MQGYNVILVFNKNQDKILMCKRAKNPYKNKYNLVGGKIEVNEIGIDAAYRELAEETGITQDDIHLKHIMDFTYHIDNCYLETYIGCLNKEVQVTGDENELIWMDSGNNFFDMQKYAGEGNIGHMVEHAKSFLQI